MSQNIIIEKCIDSNNPVLGARSKTVSPVMIEVFGELGFDFVWIDLEHFGPSQYDSHSIESLARTAEASEIELLIRLPEPEPSAIRKVLDTGVRTILISRIERAKEARTAVEASRFTIGGSPGERGSGSSRANRWGLADGDYYDTEDETTFVGVMLETEEAILNCDAILDVSELGFAFLGPSDLALSMGYPRESAHPDVQDALDLARHSAIQCGVPVGITAKDAAEATAAIDEGFRIVRVADDVGDLAPVLCDRLQSIR